MHISVVFSQNVTVKLRSVLLDLIGHSTGTEEGRVTFQGLKGKKTLTRLLPTFPGLIHAPWGSPKYRGCPQLPPKVDREKKQKVAKQVQRFSIRNSF